MNFTPIFRQETLFGAYNETSHTSDGLIHLFQEGVIDFSISDLNLNADRARIVDVAILNPASGSKESH